MCIPIFAALAAGAATAASTAATAASAISASTALAVAQGVAGVAGSIQAGMASSATHKANAAMFRTQAEQRLDKGEFDAAMAERKFARTQGKTLANAAASGASVQSFTDIFNDGAAESALEVAGIRYSAQSDANYLGFQASSQDAQAKDATVGSYFKAGSAVIGAVGTALTPRIALNQTPFIR